MAPEDQGDLSPESGDERSSSEAASAATVREVIVQDVRRPWLIPAIASALVVLLLLLLLIPGVLLYPEGQGGVVDERLLEMQRESNRGLEERIREYEGLAEAAVCFDEGGFYSESPDGQGLTPTDPLPEGFASPSPRAQTLPPEAQARSQGEVETLVDLFDAATAFILSSSSASDSLSTGTGFFIAPTTVVTNLHVIGNASDRIVLVLAPGLGGPKPARVIAQSPDHDLGQQDFAVLTIDAPGASAYFALNEEIERLDDIVAAGFPGIVIDTDERFARLRAGDVEAMPAVSFTDGIVTALQRPAGAELILHSAEVSPGNSGGPLVDRCGRVVGINTFVRSEETLRRMNYALSASELLGFLSSQGLSASSSPGRCTPGSSGDAAAAPEAGAPAAAPQTSESAE